MRTSISFSQFTESCAEFGYTSRVFSEQNNFVLYTNNGIKCEIKKNHYTVGWLARPEDVTEMRKQILEQGFTEKIGKRSESRKDAKDFININFDGEVLENFWIIVNTIESIATIVKKVRGQAIKPIPREVSERDIFKKIANRFRFFLDSEDGFGLENARFLLEGDSIDHLITIGESANRTKENSYREHIVPCILIYNKAMEMTIAKCSVAEVAQMIKTNLAIVLITNEEATKLDYELDMQTNMPEGWNFGDSVFARLNFAQIILK